MTTAVDTVEFLNRDLAEFGEFEPAPISDNALDVMEKRYFLRDHHGKILEDVQSMWRRVANAVAEGDRIHGANPRRVERTAERFYRLIASLDFLPNSPTLMNAGTKQGTLSACFVLPLTDTMEGIRDAAGAQMMVQKFGGGTGFSLSELRPTSSPISTTHGKACGPVAVLKYLSATSKLVTQGGKRDGANMAVMDVHHPDILEFIKCKAVEGDIHNFNISVGVSDEFMRAVEEGTDYPLYFREVHSDPDSPMVETDRLDAGEVFDMIVEGAWLNGEPGMIFLDEVNRNSPLAHIGKITATNPCGEQPLLPNESCNLGSINLANFVTSEPALGLVERDEDEAMALKPEFAGLHSDSPTQLPGIDYVRLAETVRDAVHFLDNTIDVNEYALPEIREMNMLARKIGLGVMGFADLLVKLGVPYDCELARTIGRDLMRFIKEEADDASRYLAEIRGPYGAWADAASSTDVPVRNACRLTVAPTGTISMLADCSSGIEPHFDLAFEKTNILGGNVTLKYGNVWFERVAERRGFMRPGLLDALASRESLQEMDDIPQDVKDLFHVAGDISPTDHVLMQAAFQESVDAGISKTINFPYEATRDDVREGYISAWKTRCKGITVYRDDSRKDQVLARGHGKPQGDAKPKPGDVQGHEPKAANGHVPAAANGAVADAELESQEVDPQFVRPHTLVDAASALMETDSYMRPAERPAALMGRTEYVETARGRLYITLNYTSTGRLFEVFIAHGKAGGNDAAMAEALSRLITMNLRCGVDPYEVAKTMRNISDSPYYTRGMQVLSVPDAVAQMIEMHATRVPFPTTPDALEGSEARQHTMFQGSGAHLASPGGDVAADRADFGPVDARASHACPDCYGKLVFEEGCEKCRSCGYSAC